MNDTQLMSRVEKMVTESEHFRYRGISVGQALKLQYYIHLRICQVFRNAPLRLGIHTIRRALSTFIRIVAGVGWYFVPAEKSRVLKKSQAQKILVVCDYPGSVEQLTMSLLDRFQMEGLMLVTASRRVYNNLQNRFPISLNLYRSLHYYRWKRLPYYYCCYRELCRNIQGEGILFKIHCFAAVCSVLQAIDYYKVFFDTFEVSAVVTTAERQWHEYVILMLARQQGIRSYSNQHGEFVALEPNMPIVSDILFVWGSETRRKLIRNGAPSERIVISGNPKLDRIFSWYLPQRKEIAARMQREYGLQADRLTVTYFTSGIGHIEELPEPRLFEIFKCFCQLCELPVNALVKLHPNTAMDPKTVYQAWLQELGVSADIQLLQSENLYDILGVTDIAVGTVSTTGLEAIGFGIPTITLNIINEVDIANYITFAGDTIECKTSQSFRRVLTEMVLESARFQLEAERTKRCREKYFKNSENFNSSEFIRNYIFADLESVGS